MADFTGSGQFPDGFLPAVLICKIVLPDMELHKIKGFYTQRPKRIINTLNYPVIRKYFRNGHIFKSRPLHIFWRDFGGHDQLVTQPRFFEKLRNKFVGAMAVIRVRIAVNPGAVDKITTQLRITIQALQAFLQVRTDPAIEVVGELPGADADLGNFQTGFTQRAVFHF